MKEVSIVIPTIGRKSLESVLLSFVSDLVFIREIIVINDSGSALNLEKYDLPKDVENLIIRIDTKGRQGASVARNLGLDLVQGDYVAFADDDDPWIRGRLGAQLSVMKKDGLKASLCLDSGNRKPTRWQGLQSPIYFLYLEKGIRRHQRFLPFGTLVFHRKTYLGRKFSEVLAEREDLLFMNSLYAKNASFAQVPVIGITVKREVWRSIRRPSFEDDFQWYCILRNFDKSIAKNFLLYIAIRNSAIGLQPKKLLRLIRVFLSE